VKAHNNGNTENDDRSFSILKKISIGNRTRNSDETVQTFCCMDIKGIVIEKAHQLPHFMLQIIVVNAIGESNNYEEIMGAIGTLLYVIFLCCKIFWTPGGFELG
jgi:hypothetical protein